MIWECRCVAYKAGERPDLEADIVPDLTELTIEADTYQGAGQGSVPKGVPSSLICPLTQVALPGVLGVLPPSIIVQQFLEIMPLACNSPHALQSRLMSVQGLAAELSLAQTSNHACSCSLIACITAVRCWYSATS